MARLKLKLHSFILLLETFESFATLSFAILGNKKGFGLWTPTLVYVVLQWMFMFHNSIQFPMGMFSSWKFLGLATVALSFLFGN